QVAEYIQRKTEAGAPAISITVQDVSEEKIQGISRSIVRLKYLPLPDYLINPVPEGHTSLIVNDGTSLTTEVAELLLKEGGRVVVLSLPEDIVAKKNTLPEGVKEVVLENTGDECIKSTIGGIENIHSFVHLHPRFEVEDGDFSPFFEKEKAIVKTVFLIAKYLKQPLDNATETGRSCFMVVVHMDGELGMGGNAHASPLCGGLFGLIKTLKLEWPAVFCRAVDLGREIESSAEHVVAEMHDPDSGLLEVGYSRDNGRQTLVAEKVDVDRGSLQRPEIGPSTVFLASGGGRGVTAECIIRLAENYKCRFILLGRSSHKDSEPDSAKGVSGEKELKRLIMQDLQSGGKKPTLPAIQKIYNEIVANREINKTLQAIKQAGGKAAYVSADVTDLSSLKNALPEAIKQMGSITGIIHGAGRLADKLIEDKTEADFEAVYSVKVKGLLAILDCVPTDDLRHLVLFSSVAGFYGNIGQSDYAIANETLNKTSHFFKKHHPLCHVSAINWGPWDSGMVSPELKKHFEKHHVALISTRAGSSMFVDEMSMTYRDQVQTVIGNILPFAASRIDNKLRTYRILRRMTLEANPFLNDHMVGEYPVVPVVCVVGWFSHTCENIYPDFKVFSCEDNKLFKGIVFDGSHAEKYVMDLKEIEKNTEEIVFEGLIWSNGSNGKKKKNFHYGSIIKLVKNIPDAPVYQNGDKRIDPASEISIEELYHNGTLFHGPVFQGIKKVLSLTPERIILECQLARISEKVLGQFPNQTVNTILMDMQYQAMLVWVKHFQNAASLPLKTRHVKFYGTIPFDKKFFITVDVRSSNEFKMVADISTYDEDYRLYIQTQGAEVTLMQKKGAKNQSTEDSVDKQLAFRC
ncbi:MAG: SDR family NAD(P)-dependent oxidoreductase, partial [Deltaproteobacteria bacterium]|nr:SDR family NAD(P)-dependent oxidoreductase [Deltaproteobacteria bacterium]